VWQCDDSPSLVIAAKLLGLADQAAELALAICTRTTVMGGESVKIQVGTACSNRTAVSSRTLSLQ
jgi:hypothetical protein